MKGTTMKTKFAMLLAGLGIAGLGVASLAQAQSHSVANYSNPPNVQADSKAGTDATPGRTATVDQQDAKHPNKGAKDAAANKGKPGKTAKQSHSSATASADEAASKHKSQSATASVHLDGASKGGAEATMQAEPSDKSMDKAGKEAFDVSPAHEAAGGKK
jgi:hypothetical protein